MTRLNIKNYTVFDEVSLDLVKGIHLVYGDNGTGKSSLLDSISWMVYGYNNKLNSKRGGGSVVKKGGNTCEVSLEYNNKTYYRKRIDRSIKTNINDIHALTPISYDIYKQVVHVDFLTTILQMTHGQKNNILGALSNIEALDNCSAKFKNDLVKIQAVYNSLLKEMYGIQGVIKEFKGIVGITTEDKFKESKTTLDMLSKKYEKCQTLKHHFNAQRQHNDHVMKTLVQHRQCPCCSQTINSSYAKNQILNLEKTSRTALEHIESVSLDIKELKEEIQKHETLVRDYNDYLKIQAKMQQITDIDARLQKTSKEISIYKKWYGFFSSADNEGIKASLANMYTNYLENYLNELRHLFNIDGLHIKFDEGMINIAIDRIPYELQGAGIRKRIDVMLCLALRQLIIYLKGDLGICNYLVMDELFSGLDDKGIHNILDLLQLVDFDYPTYIISPKFIDYSWDSTIEIKGKGKTIINNR